MLSGLTSKFSTLIGKEAIVASSDNGVAGDTTQQQAGDSAATPTVAADVKEQAPVDEQAPTPGTEASSTTSANPANILSSVRNHMPSLPSWLSRGATKPEEAVEATPASTSTSPPATATPKDKEEDNSSATGGADSDDNQVGATGGEEDPAAATGAAGLDKVKNLGNFLFSTIKGAGQKIKETSILGEFQREHDSFLKSKSKGSDGSVAPWIGHPKEEALKEEILSLSNDRRNFVRSPPKGVTFNWDWEEYAPVAKAILKDDPNLENMRYQLVPKVINEEAFWRNYFYRVQLLKESMDDSKPQKRRGSSSDEDAEGADADLEKELNEELKSFEVVGGDSKHDDKEIDSLLDLK